jgi:hypothetical protein
MAVCCNVSPRSRGLKVREQLAAMPATRDTLTATGPAKVRAGVPSAAGNGGIRTTTRRRVRTFPLSGHFIASAAISGPILDQLFGSENAVVARTPVQHLPVPVYRTEQRKRHHSPLLLPPARRCSEGLETGK